MRDEVAWLALGVAIGSKQLLARLLAEVPCAAFGHGRAAALYRALESGRAAVKAALAELGVLVESDSTAADAILETARDHGQRQEQKSLARKLDTAAQMMTAEQFREFLAAQVSEYIGHEKANPEAARGAAANGRQAGVG